MVGMLAATGYSWEFLPGDVKLNETGQGVSSCIGGAFCSSCCGEYSALLVVRDGAGGPLCRELGAWQFQSKDGGGPL